MEDHQRGRLILREGRMKEMVDMPLQQSHKYLFPLKDSLLQLQLYTKRSLQNQGKPKFWNQETGQYKSESANLNDSS